MFFVLLLNYLCTPLPILREIPQLLIDGCIVTSTRKKIFAFTLFPEFRKVQATMLRRCAFFRNGVAAACASVPVPQGVGQSVLARQTFTPSMSFLRPSQDAPMFRVLDTSGQIVAPDVPLVEDALMRKMMATMVRQHTTDHILLAAQRQGRISFYMTSFGEEASVVGSVAALKDDDYIYMQYREAAVMTYRGWTAQRIIAQCMGNQEDPAKGRQMPMHFGDPSLHVQIVSSPLTTQVPQAAGTGYALRQDKQGKICCCYFGEGAASEGDFAVGLNFAATTKAHTLFFCRNNGYAISTPTNEQYRGDGVLPRGPAYGIPSIRVDGMDILAVFAATRQARHIITSEDTPVLVEAMTYRVGHHSTSDDSSRYRSKDEISHFEQTFDPLRRFEKFLITKGLWSEKETLDLQKATRDEVLGELVRQQSVPLLPPTTLFDDVYSTLPPRLQRQRDETVAHFQRHEAYYASH